MMQQPLHRMHTQRQNGKTWLWVLLAILLLLVAWFVYWFFNNYERMTETKRLPPRGEAIYNPYYAVELFLDKEGVDVESVGNHTPLVRLPSNRDAIVARSMGATVLEHHVDAMLDWVEQGGTLVVESHDVLYSFDEDEEGNGDEENADDNANNNDSNSDIEHPLLRRLGIFLTRFDESKDEDSNAEEGEGEEATQDDTASSESEQAAEAVLKELEALARESEQKNGSGQNTAENEEVSGEDEYEKIEPATVRLPNGAQADVMVNTGVSLVDSKKLAAQQWVHKGVVYMLRVDMGKGSIWVLNDTKFMQSGGKRSYLRELLPVESYEIQRHDHAYFVHQLLTHDSQGKTKQDSKIWLLYSTDAKSLVTLLWENAHWAIKAFGLLLLVWLWWMNNRLGPSLGQLDPPRRNLLEHLRMFGNFAWKQDNAERLWKRTQEQVRASIVRKHPRLSKMDTPEQAQILADITGYPALEIHKALFGTWQGKRDFVYLTDMLRRLQKKL